MKINLSVVEFWRDFSKIDIPNRYLTEMSSFNVALVTHISNFNEKRENSRRLKIIYMDRKQIEGFETINSSHSLAVLICS